MAMVLFRSGSGLCRLIWPVTAKLMVNLSEARPASAATIAARSEPEPESASELTVKPTWERTTRSSRISHRGWHRRLVDHRAGTVSDLFDIPMVHLRVCEPASELRVCEPTELLRLHGLRGLGP